MVLLLGGTNDVHAIGRVLLAQGRPGDAADLLQQALDTWETAAGPFTPRQLQIEHDLAHALLAQGEADAALDVLEEALARAPEVQGSARIQAALRTTYDAAR